MKIYDVIKIVLKGKGGKEFRDSDKLLIWEIWERGGFVKNGVITKYDFMSATCTETIRRARQKIQATPKNFDLRSSKTIAEKRKERQASRGTFVFREKMF